MEQRVRTRLLVGCVAACVFGRPAAALVRSVDDLGALSIEELANVQVTSAQKRPEALGNTADSLYVITSEDIRRSAATTLPEALRLAPNLQVQRVDARQYSVTSRGFGGYETANKLLVLIDGRTVYSTLFSGVFWDLHQPVLEDLDRIEVISGPGGTLYGANAVNGVINVTSRSSFDTQGMLLRASGGAIERTAAVRYGGRLGDAGAFRVYASGFDRDGFPATPTRDFADGGDGIRGGFRADYDANGSTVTFQGDIFDHGGDNESTDRGHNLVGRWSRILGDGDSVEVQAYYDRTKRNYLGVFDSLTNYDVSAQGNLSTGRHTMVAGAGLRIARDRFINTANAFVLDPEASTLWIGNVFVQDSIAVGATVTATAGVKLERTTFTGLQVLPSARIAWQPGGATLLWGAVSRATRTPSRIDRNLVFPGVLVGNTFLSETLLAYEAGYRGRPTPTTSLSVSVFYNRYDHLRTTQTTPATFLPVMLSNGLKGSSYGVEMWGVAELAPGWRMSAGLSTLHKDFRLKPGRTDLENGISLGNDPRYQAQLRSQVNLGRFEIDVIARAVDDLPRPRVAAYFDADVRIGWRMTNALELHVAGSNLLQRRRDESNDDDRGQLISRSIVAGVRASF